MLFTWNHSRTSERDFNELHTQLSNLEHRYSLLHDEKVKSDQEYKSRTEAHLKQIANLKTDLETLKTVLNERNHENSVLSSDFQAMQECYSGPAEAPGTPRSRGVRFLTGLGKRLT